MESKHIGLKVANEHLSIYYHMTSKQHSIRTMVEHDEGYYSEWLTH